MIPVKYKFMFIDVLISVLMIFTTSLIVITYLENKDTKIVSLSLTLVVICITRFIVSRMYVLWKRKELRTKEIANGGKKLTIKQKIKYKLIYALGLLTMIGVFSIVGINLLQTQSKNYGDIGVLGLCLVVFALLVDSNKEYKEAKRVNEECYGDGAK